MAGPRRRRAALLELRYMWSRPVAPEQVPFPVFLWRKKRLVEVVFDIICGTEHGLAEARRRPRLRESAFRARCCKCLT